jgi:hypothetical protein
LAVNSQPMPMAATSSEPMRNTLRNVMVYFPYVPLGFDAVTQTRTVIVD